MVMTYLAYGVKNLVKICHDQTVGYRPVVWKSGHGRSWPSWPDGRIPACHVCFRFLDLLFTANDPQKSVFVIVIDCVCSVCKNKEKSSPY